MSTEDYRKRLAELSKNRDVIIKEMEEASDKFTNAHEEVYQELMSKLEREK